MNSKWGNSFFWSEMHIACYMRSGARRIMEGVTGAWLIINPLIFLGGSSSCTLFWRNYCCRFLFFLHIPVTWGSCFIFLFYVFSVAYLFCKWFVWGGGCSELGSSFTLGLVSWHELFEVGGQFKNQH